MLPATLPDCPFKIEHFTEILKEGDTFAHGDFVLWWSGSGGSFCLYAFIDGISQYTLWTSTTRRWSEWHPATEPELRFRNIMQYRCVPALLKEIAKAE